MKNRLVAALLAIFGGSVGAHKFYLRKPGTGFFYFFMFMVFLNARFPIMFLIGLFEGLGLLMMSDRDFDKKYNADVNSSEYSQQDQWQQRNPRWQRQQQPRESQQPTQAARGWKNIEINDMSASGRRNIYKESAIKKYKDFDLNGAIEEFQKSLQLEPKDIATHFNIACAYSLTEKAEKAYYHLSKAVEYGFTDFEKFNTHDDLAFARIQSQWEDFKASGYRQYASFEKNKFEETKEIESEGGELLLDQLNKLNELRQKGLITEAEYAIEKKRLNE